jgi:hypothetical protein
MIANLFTGMMKGLVVAALVVLIWMKWLALPFTGAPAYLAVALTGALVGIVAGKPVWARGALVEAALKSAVGALAGAAALYGARKWLHLEVSLGPLGAGRLSEMPAVMLPLVAAFFGLLFELDNTGSELATDKTASVLQEKSRIDAESAAEPAESSETHAEWGRMHGKR